MRRVVLLPLLAGCLWGRIEAGPTVPLADGDPVGVAIDGQVSMTVLFYTGGIRARTKLSSAYQQIAFGPQVGLQIPYLGPGERTGFFGVMGGVHVLELDMASGAVGASFGTPFLVPSATLSVVENDDYSVMLTLSAPVEYNVRLHPDMRSRPMVGVMLGVQYVQWPKRPKIFRRR